MTRKEIIPNVKPFVVAHDFLDEVPNILAQIHSQGGGYISTHRVFSSQNLSGWQYVTLYLSEEELDIEVWT